MSFCEYCKTWVAQPVGKKKKRFCNDNCRYNAWYAKTKKGKPVAAEPPQKVYDAPKLADNFVADEPLSFDRLKQEIVSKPVQAYQQVPVQFLMKRYWDEKRELTADEYPDWLSRLYSDVRLTTKQRDLIKNTNQHD